MGVSGGGGDPRWAFVVDVEAVESSRLTPTEFGTCSPPGCPDSSGAESPGGGQY